MLHNFTLTDSLYSYVSQNRRGGAPGQDRDAINGPLMFQYLMAMLQQPGSRGPMTDLFEGLVPPGAESGRMGDYVFNQEGAPLARLALSFVEC